MLKQYLQRKQVQLRAAARKALGRGGRAVADAAWWDQFFYRDGVSDRATIDSTFGELPARYHYASVELCLVRALMAHHIDVSRASVVDIGSGSGHWLGFYRSLGARRLVGMDLARSAVDHLGKAFAADPSVEIRHGAALDVLRGLEGTVDLVNAIGVMFHIVDDRAWRDTVLEVGRHTRPGGWFVVGGAFGHLDGIDVQIDREGRVNKRLRSLATWRRALRDAGFDEVTVHRNHAWLFVDAVQPENHLLLARRAAR